MKNEKQLKRIASFCSGIGGLDLGFVQAGFEVVYANEINPSFAKAYEQNIGITVDQQGIQSVKGAELPEFDLLLGSFPIATMVRDGVESYPIFEELIRILKETQPTALCLEQINPILTMKGGRIFEFVMNQLQELGYHVKTIKVSAREHLAESFRENKIYICGFKDESIFNQLDEVLPTVLEKETLTFSHEFEENEIMELRADIVEHLNQLSLEDNALYHYETKKEDGEFKVEVKKLSELPSYIECQDEFRSPVLERASRLRGIFIKEDNQFKRISLTDMKKLKGFPEDFTCIYEPMSVEYGQQILTPKGRAIQGLRFATSPLIGRLVANRLSTVLN